MNREQRRKAYKEKVFDARDLEAAKNEGIGYGVNLTSETMILALIMTLNKQLGFGIKRITPIIEELNEKMIHIDSEEKRNQLKKEVADKFGIELR